MQMPGLELPQTLPVGPDWIAMQTPSAWLTEAEQQRGREFVSPIRRRDWLAGRLAIKRLLWTDWNISPAACAVGTDGTAPCLDVPGLEHINWSLSHSKGWGAASWADTRTEGTVGVDIQHIRPVHPGLAARLLCEEECVQHSFRREQWGHDEAILLVWALKEAAIKARRLPWGHVLKSITVRLTEGQTAQITLPGEPHPFAGCYARHGAFWVARVVRPLPLLGG